MCWIANRASKMPVTAIACLAPTDERRYPSIQPIRCLSLRVRSIRNLLWGSHRRRGSPRRCDMPKTAELLGCTVGTMRPLADLAPHASSLRGVFSNIDDTLTHDGAVVVEAYAALERARAAGLRVVLVTGRPAG